MAFNGLSKNKTSEARRFPSIFGKFSGLVPSGDWKVYIKGVIKCASGETYIKSNSAREVNATPKHPPLTTATKGLTDVSQALSTGRPTLKTLSIAFFLNSSFESWLHCAKTEILFPLL